MTKTEAAEATTAARAAIRANLPDYYRRNGWVDGDSFENDLIRIIVHAPRGGREGAAVKFRMQLWMRWDGGGASAGMTHRVFRALGRGDECDPRWI